jgi:hypothetical protein
VLVDATDKVVGHREIEGPVLAAGEKIHLEAHRLVARQKAEKRRLAVVLRDSRRLLGHVHQVAGKPQSNKMRVGINPSPGLASWGCDRL